MGSVARGFVLGAVIPLAIVLMVVVAVPLFILLAAVIQQPGPNVSLQVEVINQTSSTGRLEWQSASGSGSESIGPCGSADVVADLGPGAWQVTISEGSATLTSKGNASAPGLTYEYFGIVAPGQIQHLYTLSVGQAVPPRPSGC